MQTFSARSLRILYAAGPGNVASTYEHWQQGQDDPSQVAVTYSSQFFDVCCQLNASAYVIASHPDRRILRDGPFVIEHRPKRFEHIPCGYHLGQLWYGLQLIRTAIWFRADVAVVSSGTTYWFMLSLLKWLGIAVVPSLHCVLWRKHGGARGSERVTNAIDRRFFRYACHSILTVSQDVMSQVQEITRQHCPIFLFNPTYRAHVFQTIPPADTTTRPFRVLYVGRMETEKGVWDILAMAQRLAAAGHCQIVFDLCGEGSQLPAIQTAIQQVGLAGQIICHGHCDQTRLRSMFSHAHVVLVPTRKEFVEGFNKVVAEAILAGRPIVTSDVCPALAYVRQAAVEVLPEDVAAYAEAILRLATDPEFYQQKQHATGALQGQFYNHRSSWGRALKLVLRSIEVSYPARSASIPARLHQMLPSR